MNEITEMNVANAKAVRKLIDNQLPNLLSEHGLTFELGNAVYDNDSIKFNGFRISIKGGLSQDKLCMSHYPEIDHYCVFKKQGCKYHKPEESDNES